MFSGYLQSDNEATSVFTLKRVLRQLPDLTAQCQIAGL